MIEDFALSGALLQIEERYMSVMQLLEDMWDTALRGSCIFLIKRVPRQMKYCITMRVQNAFGKTVTYKKSNFCHKSKI